MESVAKQKTRLCRIDLLRIIACFCVIVNHTNSDLFSSWTPAYWGWYPSLAYFFFSKIAVPLFMMITGYLLLGKLDSWKKTWERVFRVAVVLLGCGVVYGFYYGITEEPAFSIQYLIWKVINVYRELPSYSLWYLYTYIGVLVMMPYLQKMASRMERLDYHILFCMAGVFLGIFPILEHYVPGITYNYNFDLPLFGGYLCVLFIGQYFARFKPQKTKGGIFGASAALIGTLVFLVIATCYEFTITGGEDYLYYDQRTSFPVIMECVSVFYLASCIELPDKVAGIVSEIGKCTFGIYLLSDLVTGLLKPGYGVLRAAIHPLVAMVVFETAIFLCGLLITVLLRKLPVVKKYL